MRGSGIQYCTPVPDESHHSLHALRREAAICSVVFSRLSFGYGVSMVEEAACVDAPALVVVVDASDMSMGVGMSVASQSSSSEDELESEHGSWV